ncbi:MAG: hypothetical protein AAGG80_05685, partial [Pseudomonadota bacterium]
QKDGLTKYYQAHPQSWLKEFAWFRPKKNETTGKYEYISGVNMQPYTYPARIHGCNIEACCHGHDFKVSCKVLGKNQPEDESKEVNLNNDFGSHSEYELKLHETIIEQTKFSCLINSQKKRAQINAFFNNNPLKKNMLLAILEKNNDGHYENPSKISTELLKKEYSAFHDKRGFQVTDDEDLLNLVFSNLINCIKEAEQAKKITPTRSIHTKSFQNRSLFGGRMYSTNTQADDELAVYEKIIKSFSKIKELKKLTLLTLSDYLGLKKAIKFLTNPPKPEAEETSKKPNLTHSYEISPFFNPKTPRIHIKRPLLPLPPNTEGFEPPAPG